MVRTIKSIRIQLGMNQDEMAKKLGISTKAYGRKERYVQRIYADELKKISRLSGVPMDNIYLGEFY